MDSVNLRLLVDVSGEAEIANLQLIRLRANKQVFWLDVSVHYILRVEVVDCLEQLVDEEFDALAVEAIGLFLEDFEQVAIHEFEYEVQSTLALEGLDHPDDRLVFQDIEHFDFSLCRLLYNLIFLCGLLEFFDGD